MELDPQSVENRTRELGREIFQSLSASKPKVFSNKGISSQLMAWSMNKPTLKTNLFRLVDVLPNLKSQKEIAAHISEYLSHSADELGGLLGWGLKGGKNSWRSRFSAFFVRHAVTQMASMFIAGESPQRALRNLSRLRKEQLAFTVDLLGEYCVSEREAEIYLKRYEEALKVLSVNKDRLSPHTFFKTHPGETSPVCVSVKLTALYSQCSPLNHKKSVEVLSARLSQLVRLAASHGAQIYVDAEDSASNPMIYETFMKVFSSSEFREIAYPGIVLQAYARNSLKTAEQLITFARERKAPIAIRLVKGAYWDSETFRAKQNNWPNPLFENKEETDANYEKIAAFLLDNHKYCLPAFGSHNIRSLSKACAYAEAKGLDKNKFELQMLYGMAEPIAAAFRDKGYYVRLYVPLGDMVVGMGYLVRRLLENTSNESFLRHTFFESSEIENLLNPPVTPGSEKNTLSSLESPARE